MKMLAHLQALTTSCTMLNAETKEIAKEIKHKKKEMELEKATKKEKEEKNKNEMLLPQFEEECQRELTFLGLNAGHLREFVGNYFLLKGKNLTKKKKDLSQFQAIL